ncbi:BMP family ABC transporter substrate-binding protein [Galbitalea sp. SE-J8]|uniref:BMP family lipoprotein n=1 Tax=Galbitalea sp. SE-J8 TaxID=3054952 RepID=UPI00259C9510|nr:BMP family ABC transporter substrate-binding protein [Galbitalea sp. SE-J8]MDM4762762.1 BMP family ABC transporter substrate-binding protein [Galbitalea sp. SE-J8]
MTILNRRSLSGIALVGASAIVLAGCASAPETTPGSTDSGSAGPAVSDFLPCMVSDAGGFDDKSFNQLGFEGLQEAAGALGVDYKTAESKSDADYAPGIDNLIAQGCTLVITVGFNLSAATVTAAKANPDIEFAIIDDAADNDFDGKVDAPNIKPILFDTAQAAFLAGYATASYTKTGTIATWGGMNYPTVAIFSDGLAQGIAYYNKQKSKDVKLIGYDPKDPDSYTVTGGFEANDAAKTTAANFLDQGADVLVPVGGPIFQSAGAAIQDAGSDAVLLGADADVYNTFPTYDSLYFTSILKNIDPAVQDVVKSAASGALDYTPYIGTLDNGGVGIAPFHDYESKVSPDLQGELDTITNSIKSGDIKVTSYLSK